ncbi:bacteriohemerythrin [Hydrogenimonas sp.]
MNESLFIVWGEEDALGIPLIDEQHRGIVSMINTLYYFMKRGDGEREQLRMLEMLEHFFTIHFIVEEELMEAAGYEERKAHAEAHERFLKELRELRASIERFNEPLELLKSLKGWWLDHIKGEDLKYVPSVRKWMEEG